MKKATLTLLIFLLLLTLTACGETPPGDAAPPSAGTLLPEAAVSSHLEGIVRNARFLDIPTYEGSGQAVHPQVLYFEEAFMGYHYIMVMTPYPYSNNAHENPSILGSQDGMVWEVPPGVTNPVFGPPPDVEHGGYYSDPFLLRRGDELELWFRHTAAREIRPGHFLQNNTHNRIYRTRTDDLANWSPLETIFDCPSNMDHYMSPVVMHDGAVYRVWYTNFDSVLYYIESPDLVNWSPRVSVPADLGGLGIWHLDIVFTGEEYEALFTSANWSSEPTFRLFYATSSDGLSFGRGHEISIDRISPDLEGMTVHKCSFVRQNGIYQMYIAVFTPDSVWKLFYFEIAEEHLDVLFD